MDTFVRKKDPHYPKTYKSHYLTVYKRDYVKQAFIPLEDFTNQQQFKDPIAESFKKFLKIDKAEKPPEETLEDYYPRFEKQYPKVAKINFETPVNVDVLRKDQLKLGRTVYTVEYCDIEKDDEYYKNLADQNKVTLPDDWVIPETTYLKNYKDPSPYLMDECIKATQIIPPTSLTHSTLGNPIIKTGETEYQEAIGHLGGHIVENQLHGKINPPKWHAI